MSESSKIACACTKFKAAAVVFASLSFVLGVASWFVPPRGMIDSSVVAFVGEMFAFAALFMAWEAIERGIDTKITKGDTKVEFNNPDKPAER